MTSAATLTPRQGLAYGLLGLPPRAAGGPGAMPDWLSEMLMVRLPARVQDLWAPPAQQEILVQMLEAMVRTMRATMPAPPGAPGA